MIEEKIVYRCPSCDSERLVKNGKSASSGKQQYICRACGRSGVINPNPREKHSEAEKEQILNAYFEGASMRGVTRIFDVSRPTLEKWIKKSPTGAGDRGYVGRRTSRRCAGIG